MATIAKRAYPVLVRAHVRGGQLDPTVAEELARYFRSRPDLRAREAADHGFDPLSDPARYIAAERAEGYHASLSAAAGPVTLQTLQRWEQEEDAEQLAKEQPTASQSHVDTPLGSDEDDEHNPEPFDTDVKVLKADDEQRIVYGVVLEPDTEDSQGDIVSKEDVELAAHRFLYAQVAIGDQHRKLAPAAVKPVESFIAPCDFELGGQQVRKGSWVLAAHVPDDDLWEQVKKGEKAAWSVAGSGIRTPL